MPTFLSLFAGIGGFDLGLGRAGHECVGQIELDPFCSRVLERRWPSVKRFGRVETFTRELWGHDGAVDILTGGFPCQDLSVAGKRAGLQGERSGLFWEIIRIQKILHAPWGLFENVPGLLSSNRGRDMWTVLQGLRECWPAVGWRILDSQHFGVAQRRRRVFFVCGPTDASVASVLFESEGGAWYSAASEEARAGAAASLTSGIEQSGRIYDGKGLAPSLHGHGASGGAEGVKVFSDSGPSFWREGMSRPLSRRDWHDSGPGLVTGPIRTNVYNNSDPTMEAQQLVTHPLKAEGADASEDGTGRGVPMIAQPVRSNPYNNSDPAMEASMHIQTGMGVRRLTPVECERLQGFPDNWTCLCDEAPCRCPDSSRYRVLGNAVTVNVAEWLGQRLAEAGK